MQKDYILRLIEQAAAVIAGIIRKAETGHYQEARADFDKLCIDTVGLDLDRVKNLTPDAVSELLEPAGSLRPMRSVMLAEILLAEAQVTETQEHLPFALPNYVHAFCLISDTLSLMSHDDETRYRAKLKTLAPKLESYKDMPQLSNRLDTFHGEIRLDSTAPSGKIIL